METLTPTEQQDFNQAAEMFNLDNDTKLLAEKLFTNFKRKINPSLTEKLSSNSLGVYCAILSASKSQAHSLGKASYNEDNILSINEIIVTVNKNTKKNITTEEFLHVLKLLIDKESLGEETFDELKNIITKFAFTFTLFVKYQDMIKQLDLKDKSNGSPDYIPTLLNLGWLLFLETRNSIKSEEIVLVQNVFLLLGTLAHLIYYMKDNIESGHFETMEITINERSKRNKEEILKGILGLLPKNNLSPQDVLPYENSIEETLKNLNSSLILVATQKNNEEYFDGIYSSSLIDSNIKKLEDYYKKRLQKNDLDERFYKDSKKVQTGKLTPFSKYGPNKLNINVNVMNEDNGYAQTPQRSFYKPLSYQASEQISLGSNIKDIKNSNQSIPASPIPSHASATPMSRALEMYKWLNEKLKIRKNESGLPPTLEKYFSIIGESRKEEILTRARNLLDPERENPILAEDISIQKQLKDKQHQIMNLYYKILEELLVQEERKTRKPNLQEILRNENFHRALLACSIEVVFFINNYSNLSFQKLLDLCKIPAFEFWRIISSFMTFDPKMPHALKKHFYDIELRIIMKLAWKKDSSILEVLTNLVPNLNPKKEFETPQSYKTRTSTNPFEPDSLGNENTNFTNISSETSNGTQNSQMEVESNSSRFSELNHSQLSFFKRVLHHAAVQTYQICENLKLKDQMTENVWSTIQHVLGFETTLLIERNIVQLLLCCVYGVCKVSKHPLKFSDIIAKYQQLPTFNEEEYTEIVRQVYIDDNQKIDLIAFYNKVFIVQMKDFLLNLPQIEKVEGTPSNKIQNENTPSKVTLTPNPKPKIPLLVTNSPLREFLPQQLKHQGMQTPDPKNTPVRFTPKTKALYAFGESPGGVLDTINKASKRQIEFEEGQEGNTLRKQVKTQNPIFEKILEHAGKESDSSSNKTLGSKRNLFGNAPLNIKKGSDNEDSRSQSFLGSNSNSLSFSIPLDSKDRTISSSMSSLVDKQIDSEDSKKMVVESASQNGNLKK